MLLRRLTQVDKPTSRLSTCLFSRSLSTQDPDGDAMAKFFKKASHQGKPSIWSSLIHEVKDRKQKSAIAIAPSVGSVQSAATDDSKSKQKRKTMFNFAREKAEAAPERKRFSDRIQRPMETSRPSRKDSREYDRGDDERSASSQSSDSNDLMAPAEKRNGQLVDPTIRPFLFDLDHFEAMAMKGNTISTEKMDPLDALLSASFMESFKTESGTVITRLENARHKRWKRPVPRSLSQLLAASTPNIQATPGSAEYTKARDAWVAIERNVFYNSHEQQRMVDCVATFHKQFAKWCAEVPNDALDIICDPRFRPLEYQAACNAESERLAKEREKREVGEDEYIFSDDAAIGADVHDTVVDEDEL